MVLKRIAQALAGLLLVVVVLLLVSRFWPASDAQKQARAALEAPVEWAGDNAWPLLATLDHDGLDTAARQALVQTHVAEFAQWAQATAAQRHASLEGVSDASDAPVLPAAAALERPAYCRPGNIDGCLAHVRADTAAVSADVAARAGLIERIAGLAAYQHARSPYLPDVSSPLPDGLGRLFTPLAAHALSHVQGNSAQALDGLCRDMGSARMLASRSDSLVVTMVGAGWLQANGQLLAAVMAELPSDQPLPAHCAAALQPLDAEAVSLCGPLRGEYALIAAGLGHTQAQTVARLPAGSWYFDLDKTLNRQAESLGSACLAPLQARIAQDLPLDGSLQAWRSLSLWHIECGTNYLGCVLSAIAAPAYDRYIARMQDVAAGQRLLGAWLWLRQQPAGAGMAEQLAHLPAQWYSAQRPVMPSADGKALEVARYERSDQSDALPLRLSLPMTSAE